MHRPTPPVPAPASTSKSSHSSGPSLSRSVGNSSPPRRSQQSGSGGSPSNSESQPQVSFSDWAGLFDGEDEEEQFEDKEAVGANKDCILFLIDCQEKMYRKNAQGEVPLHSAIKCAVATLTEKIISSENDLVGVCFYGTKEKKNLNDFEGITVFQDLDVPDAQRILDLEALLKKEEGTLEFGTFEGDFPLCDALWTCSIMFSTCTVKVGHRRVFLFTSEDNPNSGNNYLREQAIQRAKDLTEVGIDIELFSINTDPERPFDFMQFYKEVISIPDDEDTGVLNFDSSSKFEEMKTRVRRKVFKKRALTRLPFFLGPNLEVAVRLYNLTQETKKGNFVWLDGKSNQPLKTVTKWVCEDTGSLLMPSQIKLSYRYGGERVLFEREEVQQIKTIDAPGIRLMGFKPRSALKHYHNLTHASFIYPDELQVKGSTTLLAALLDRMLALEQIAIARMTPRQNSAPRFVALLPQLEKYDQDNVQIEPAGFYVIPLPYADDIRKINTDPPVTASADQILVAKKMVRKLRIKFDSRDFENPVLQKHYANLQALALDRDAVDAVQDMIMPDVEGFQKLAPVINEYKLAVFGEGEYNPALTKTKKRAAAGERAAKKPKTDRTVEELDEVVRSGNAKSLKVDELKAFLTMHSVKGLSKMKKPELIVKANEFFGIISEPPSAAASAAPSDDEDD